MPVGVSEVRIIRIKDHWEIYIDDEFYCSADTYNEAVKDIKALCERSITR